jgi:PQQ-like domain
VEAHLRDTPSRPPPGCSATEDGSALVVTGFTYNVMSPRGVPDVVTVSYSVATGDELWRDRYDGRNGWDEGTDVAVGPDGVFVSGISNVGNNPDPLVLAYAPTGSMRWKRRFPSGGSWEDASNLAVSPDGASIYLTSEGGTMPTVAYDASSGERRWVRRVGQTLGWAEGEAIAVAADGMTVYVGGWWYGDGNGGAITSALDTLTGETVWQDLSHPGSAWSVVAPSNGATVLVSGETYVNSLDYQTVAYES